VLRLDSSNWLSLVGSTKAEENDDLIWPDRWAPSPVITMTDRVTTMMTSLQLTHQMRATRRREDRILKLCFSEPNGSLLWFISKVGSIYFVWPSSLGLSSLDNRSLNINHKQRARVFHDFQPPLPFMVEETVDKLIRQLETLRVQEDTLLWQIVWARARENQQQEQDINTGRGW
jgi:hypothetical protein